MALYFGGDKSSIAYSDGAYIPNFYKSPKYYAFGNRYSKNYEFRSAFGGTKERIYPLDNTVRTGLACVGHISGGHTAAVLNTCICKTDETMTTFTDYSSSNSAHLLENIGVNSLTECKSVTFCYRLKQTTYDGDILLRPFVWFGLHSNSFSESTPVMYDADHVSIYGRPVLNGYAYSDSTSGFTATYKASYKGKYASYRHKLTDDEIARLNELLSTMGVAYPRFLCKMFRLDGGTDIITDMTAYFGGYLVFEV